MWLLKSGFLERNEGENYSNDNANILTRASLLCRCRPEMNQTTDTVHSLMPARLKLIP